jgi:hypothetical protein
MAKNLANYDELVRAYHYAPESGVFTHLTGPLAGQEVTRRNGDNYLRLLVGGIYISGQRAAHLYMLGELPVGNVGYVDFCRYNLKWSNLCMARGRDHSKQKGAANHAQQFIDHVRSNRTAWLTTPQRGMSV